MRCPTSSIRASVIRARGADTLMAPTTPPAGEHGRTHARDADGHLLHVDAVARRPGRGERGIEGLPGRRGLGGEPLVRLGAEDGGQTLRLEVHRDRLAEGGRVDGHDGPGHVGHPEGCRALEDLDVDQAGVAQDGEVDRLPGLIPEAPQGRQGHGPHVQPGEQARGPSHGLDAGAIARLRQTLGKAGDLEGGQQSIGRALADAGELGGLAEAQDVLLGDRAEQHERVFDGPDGVALRLALASRVDHWSATTVPPVECLEQPRGAGRTTSIGADRTQATAAVNLH